MRQALDLLSMRLGREATQDDLRRYVCADLKAGDQLPMVGGYYGLTNCEVLAIAAEGRRRRATARQRVRRAEDGLERLEHRLLEARRVLEEAD